MRKIFCRVCGAYIPVLGWSSHVAKHKRAYCRLVGRLEGEYWRVSWERVVRLLNPKNAKQLPAESQEEEDYLRSPIKTLNEFMEE